tara:strand:+ start:235 stop:645 length:411 start_codon:yes stop_codon:yes gene_type:complete
MIKEFYLEPFEDGVSGWFMGLLVWVVTLLLLGLIGWGLFYVIDSCWLPTYTDIGEVVGKGYSPAHYTTTYVMSGKVMVPITNYIPESWCITISINGLNDAVNVSEYNYNIIEVGRKLECDYVTGRISSGVYINEIR